METKKIYWIIGASSGIGLTLAERLAAEGHYIICTARREQRLNALKLKYPNRVKTLVWDVSTSSEDAVEQQLKLETDVLDCMIYCAGICEYDDGPSLDGGMYRQVMETNFFGLLKACKIAIPLLKKSTLSPKLVGLSSLAARAAFPRAGAYGASKAAMEYFLQSLKIDLKDQNIDVSIVRPGFVDTELTQKNDFDMPFLMNVDDAAEHILKGLEANKLFVNFPLKLSLPLAIAGFLPKLWLKYVAPKFRKMESL